MSDTQQEQADRLKSALRRLPGPVSLITSFDAENSAPAGMVASAVIPVSMEPASMLISVNKSASIHPIITGSGKFCINLLATEQTDFVSIYSNPKNREKRFTSEQWDYREGLAFLPKACANIFCSVDQTKAYGSHDLIIGKVDLVLCGDDQPADPLGWLEGDFAQYRPIG